MQGNALLSKMVYAEILNTIHMSLHAYYDHFTCHALIKISKRHAPLRMYVYVVCVRILQRFLCFSTSY